MLVQASEVGWPVEQVCNPVPVVVRVYIVEASGLTPMDSNNTSDPYLSVTLGE